MWPWTLALMGKWKSSSTVPSVEDGVIESCEAKCSSGLDLETGLKKTRHSESAFRTAEIDHITRMWCLRTFVHAKLSYG